MGGPLLVVAALGRLEPLASNLALGVRYEDDAFPSWIDWVPLFVIPVVVVCAVLLYGEVIPAAMSERDRQGPDRSVAVPVAGVALIVWTALWMRAAFFAAYASEDVNSEGRVIQPGGLLFAAALLAWASPFVVSAIRRRGLAWSVVATAAVVAAVWGIVELYANPFYCGCA